MLNFDVDGIGRISETADPKYVPNINFIELIGAWSAKTQNVDALG